MKLRNIIFIAALLPFLGCSDFLDVSPKDKQTAAQLFSTKAGFYTALNGIYDGLASEDLYGRKMSYEAIDVMSKRYITSSSNPYFKGLSTSNYTSADVAKGLSAIWQKAYELIMAANILIDHIESQKGLLTQAEADLMKGEMLAVRAFLHLDMMRLFGPRWDNNPEALSIPYNESSKVTVLPLLPLREAIGKVIGDLDAAEELLADDPVITDGPLASIVEGESVQLRYRQFRLNYYATIGLKARAYLWGGDKENALIQAKRLLNDPVVGQHFPAIDPNKLLANASNPDRVFSSEVLAGVYVKNRDEAYTSYFAATAPSVNFLHPHEKYVTGAQSSLFTHLLLGSETMDYRFQAHWEVSSGLGIAGHIFTKYKPIDKPDPNDKDSEYFYSRMIPLIKMAEMFYIAVECEPNVVDGVKWYNKIRGRRGCPAFPEALAPYIDSYFGGWGMLLSQEHMREFYGEGQAFFFLKRVVIVPGYPAGMVSIYDNGEAQANSQIDIMPPLPEGEMR